MRRSPKISKLTIIFLALAGIFNLASFALDQQVVQQEDKLREINRKVRTYESEIETLIFGINTNRNPNPKAINKFTLFVPFCI